MKIIALLLSTGLVMAQTTGEVTTTTQPNGVTTTTTVPLPPAHNETAGTIVTYDASALTLVVATPDSTAPITYRVNTATAFVDEANKPIPGTFLTHGSSVTVYYGAAGDSPLATKVILHKLTTPVQ